MKVQNGKTTMYLAGIPTSLKNRISDMAHFRKKEGKSNATIRDVAIELIEKALSLPEYSSEETNNSKAA